MVLVDKTVYNKYAQITELKFQLNSNCRENTIFLSKIPNNCVQNKCLLRTDMITTRDQ